MVCSSRWQNCISYSDADVVLITLMLSEIVPTTFCLCWMDILIWFLPMHPSHIRHKHFNAKGKNENENENEYNCLWQCDHVLV